MSRPPHFPFRSAEAREEYLAFYDRRGERWPLPSETRTVPTSFGETFVRITGPEDAPPLVLLPGMSSNGLMWETMIEPFARRYRTYAVDSVSDVGRSVPARDVRSASDYAQWLDELFEALELRDVNLVGMSYGAWITAHMALLRPERLRRTVWLAPAGVVARLSILWIVLALLTAVSKWIHRRFTYWMFADAVKTPEGRRIAEELIADTQVMIRCYAPRPIVTPTTMSDAQLRSIRVPSLLLVGENETVGSASKAMRRLSRVAPQIEAELIPGAGHDLPIAQRELTTRRVLEFLQAS
ncbi:MAG: alpha/beta hydrolase [Sandaracinaceae bacterium]|nr:alpha/beta hydrolase [Sandaracinaceae bacterium]